MKKRAIPFVFILVLTICSYVANAGCVGISGGSGTQGDPWLISNCTELQAMDGDQDCLDDYFVLDSDIDCDVAPYNEGSGFNPIGYPLYTGQKSFNGSFDGKGHKISGLFFNVTNADLTYGLFAIVKVSNTFSEIKNVVIDSAKIVEGISGYTWGGKSALIATIGAYDGGVVSVKNCSVSGVIDSPNSFYGVGGLIGQVSLGGSSGSSLIVENSYSSVDVTGLYYAGSLMGAYRVASGGTSTRLNITDCYASGDVHSTYSSGSYSGGLIGYVNSESSSEVNIDNCFATGSVSSVGGNPGGISSYVNVEAGSTATISNSWYLTGSASSCIGTNTEGSVSCSDASPINYFYNFSNAPLSSWDSTDTWQICPGEKFPFLSFENVRCAFYIDVPVWDLGIELYDENDNIVTESSSSDVLYIKEDGVKKLEFSIDDDVNLTNVTIEVDDEKTVVKNLGSLSGVTGTHSLFIDNSDSAGVYVCPEANSISEVNAECTDFVYFDHDECASTTTKTGYTCTIDGSDYKISGLIGSGIGEGCLTDGDCTYGTCVNNVCVDASGNPVPEFHEWAMILGLSITLAGLFFSRRDRK